MRPMTMHGTSEMQFVATLGWETSVVADLPTLDGYHIKISSGEIVTGGPFYFTDDTGATGTVISVATDSKGEARFLLTGKGLYHAGITAEILLTVKAELIGHNAEGHTFFKVEDNIAAIVEHFQASVPHGPIWQDAFVDKLRTRLTSQAFEAMMAARDSGHAGWANNALGQENALAPAIGDLAIDFYEHGDSPSQRIVLRFLAHLHQAGADAAVPRWLLNGLDYDPIVVRGVQNVHQHAVLLRERKTPGETTLGQEARFFDLWVHQKPEVFTFEEWQATRTADPSSYVPGRVYLPDYVNGFYPGNSGPYPTADGVPVPASLQAYVQCPRHSVVSRLRHVAGRSGASERLRPAARRHGISHGGRGPGRRVVGRSAHGWHARVGFRPALDANHAHRARLRGGDAEAVTSLPTRSARSCSYASVSITENDTATLSVDPSAATLPSVRVCGRPSRRADGDAGGQPAVSPSKGEEPGWHRASR